MQFITPFVPVPRGPVVRLVHYFALFPTAAIFHPHRCTLGKTRETTVSSRRLSRDDGAPRSLSSIRQHVSERCSSASHYHRDQLLINMLSELKSDKYYTFDYFSAIIIHIIYHDNFPCRKRKDIFL